MLAGEGGGVKGRGIGMMTTKVIIFPRMSQVFTRSSNMSHCFGYDANGVIYTRTFYVFDIPRFLTSAFLVYVLCLD